MILDIIDDEFRYYKRTKGQKYMVTSKKAPFRVLTFDGGGILGFYEAAVLHEISKLSNKRFRDTDDADIGNAFKLICGTSTGSIIAAGLAKGIKIAEIKSLYKLNAKAIFPSPKPSNKLMLTFWAITNTFKASGNQVSLKKTLEGTLKESTFLDVWNDRNIALCIPAVNAQTHKPSVLKTPHLPRLSRDDNMKLSDACLSSAAAPIYFPIAEVDDPNNSLEDNSKIYHVDGGLWANNPVLIGLTEALEMADEEQPIEIYSIGTPDILDTDVDFTKNLQKGLLGWKFGLEVINMSLYSQAQGHDYIAKLLAKSLSTSGRSIDILRLPSCKSSISDLQSLDLDKNDEKAFEVMQKLAKQVALDIDSVDGQSTLVGQKYRTLFKGMDPL